MSENNTRQGHILFIDAVKAVAIILVVTIHVAAYFLYDFNTMSRSVWWIANVYDALARPAVPLFLIVSGLLLLNPAKTESTETFFRKRVLKVGIPVLVWSLAYVVFRIVVQDQSLSNRRILTDLLVGTVYYHLGFFYYLIGLYLATPILRVYIRGASRQDLRYFLGVWLLIPLTQLLYKFTDFRVGIAFTVAVGYSVYYILGHYLRERVIGTKRQLMLVSGVWLVSALVTILGTYQLTYDSGGELDQFFYGYLNLTVVAMAVCLFLLLKSVRYEALYERVPRARQIVGGLGLHSYGIYLIHPMILYVLDSGDLGFAFTDFIERQPLIGIPLVVFVVTVLSYAVVLFIRRLPLGKIIIP